ncbi:MAG: hypothetical protein JXR37_28950 [Kiritimatiellae bacterium]|nr:hypothetical protein [Kiritimatiellia bacterium]
MNHTRMLVRCLACAAAGLLIAGGCEDGGDGGSSPATVDVTGSWQGNDNAGCGSGAANLVQNGSEVTGTCVYDSGEEASLSGSVSDDFFRATLRGANTYTIEATVTGNGMNGTWSGGGGSGNFAASRR